VTHPLVGSRVPDFSLRDHNGREVSPATLAGASALLVFVPWAFSPVCTYELEQLRDASDVREQVGQLVVINCDSMYVNQEWADANAFDSPVLSDFWPHGEVSRAFGVFDEERGRARRGTFCLDADGVVRWVVENPDGSPRDLELYRAELARM